MDLREQIIAADDHKSEVIEVPEWDCSITLKTSSLAGVISDHDDWDFKKKMVHQIIECCHDESGVKIFAEDDMNAIMQKDVGVLNRIFEAINKLHGFGNEVEEGKKS